MFYLWPIRPALKCKVPKYYDQDYLKIFLLLYTLPMMIQVTGKSIHLTQKNTSIEKLQISKVESFLKSNFDLTQICKIVLSKNLKFGTLTQLSYFIFFIKDWRKAIEKAKKSHKKCPYIKVWRRLGQVMIKNCCSGNPRQNILAK